MGGQYARRTKTVNNRRGTPVAPRFLPAAAPYLATGRRRFNVSGTRRRRRLSFDELTLIFWQSSLTSMRDTFVARTANCSSDENASAEPGE
jgi:hypothetical protein